MIYAPGKSLAIGEPAESLRPSKDYAIAMNLIRPVKDSSALPRNARRLSRILQILSIIEQNHFLPCTQLAEIVGISRRTLFRDLAILRDAGIEINYSPTKGGYLTAILNRRLGIELSERETAALLLWGRRNIRPAPGSEFGKSLHSATEKILNIVHNECRDISTIDLLQVGFMEEFKHNIQSGPSLLLKTAR